MPSLRISIGSVSPWISSVPTVTMKATTTIACEASASSVARSAAATAIASVTTPRIPAQEMTALSFQLSCSPAICSRTMWLRSSSAV
ncbi:hypothetical protein D3C74_483130 [compost metagenome]